jgi:hypothetical protein
MFYTVTAAAKIAGLNKSTVLAAIETGQISGTKDLFGEWKITDSDLHRLCVAVKEGTTHEGPQQSVPGLGKVNSIVLWGKRWIVVTNKGLISTP